MDVGKGTRVLLLLTLEVLLDLTLLDDLPRFHAFSSLPISFCVSGLGGFAKSAKCQSMPAKLLTWPCTPSSIFINSATNPMLGEMLGLALTMCRYAFLSVQFSEMTRYAKIAAADLDLPALQCT